MDEFIDNSLLCFDENKYIKSFLNFQRNIFRLLNESIQHIATTLDNQFKNSLDRVKRWNINKSDISRTITTIFGTITFYRTYYESKTKKDKFFYVDKVLGLEAFLKDMIRLSEVIL